jgi:hypothetical protein
MILTKALSGIARSGATRAGYPVLQGAKVPLYALSNVARSGATRSNYVGSRMFINIGGIDFGSGALGDGVGILAESLTKADAINNTPVTLQFTARGWVPVEGADVVLTLGSKNNQRREFGGTILSTRHRYVGDKPVAANMLYDVSCIDYTWGLDTRKVSGNYTNASVAAIAASLLTFAPGYTLRVDPDIGAEILDQITFTEQGLSSAFTQLAKRVGGDFLCDFTKVVHLFFENTALTPPTIVNAVHPSLATIAFTRDLSQVATRVLGNFGGSNALEQVAPGDIWIPVETAAWYLPGGGVVLVGQQRVTYGGIVVGGGGSLVGPGAAPTGAPNASLLPGAGVEVGSHDYAVTFKTASGESIAGPRITVPVGLFLAPPTAPTPGAPGPGAGPDPGVHDYAVSFVISTGETVPGPRTSVSTGLMPPPDTGPTPDRVDPGPGPDPGTHDYAVAFVTATGATPAGPIGSQVTTGFASPPGNGPNLAVSVGAGPDAGTHAYACTFVTSSGETTPGPLMSIQTGVAGPPAAAPTSSPSCQQYPSSGNYSPGPGGGNVGDSVSYSVTYTNDGTWADESAMGPGSPPIQIQAYVGGPPNQCLRTVSIGAPPGGVAGFRLYVSVNGMTPAILTWFYTSNYPSGVSGYVVSGMPTQGWYPGPGHGPIASVVNVSNIPTSAGAVTARKLYRQSGGAGLRLVATLSGNSTTTYTDTTPNASLGAAAPGTNTATAQTVHLSSIPTGPTGVTGRALYRRSGGQGLRWVTTISGNSTTTYTDTMPNASLGGAPQGTSTATLQQMPLTAIPLGNSLVTARKLYRTPANTGGGTLKLVATLADNTTTTFTDTVPDASLGAAALTVSTAQAAQVQLSAIPVGAPAVIARNLYRTKANASQLQLRATINDNTTQTFLDTAADATLGANVPTSDTSLLAQPAGNVLIGSPSLPCATVAGFLPTGGWVTAGSQNLRYTGISGTNLIGIPPSGPGAITATLSYNTTIVQAAMLNGIPTTGLGVIQYPILKGDPVNVFVQVDDLAAQAAVRAQLAGSDGIIEDEIQDGRLSYTEGRARCQARLDLLAELDSEGKVGVIAVTYVCRDINAIAGATVTVNLGPPINLRGDFLIQRVGVAQFNVPNLHPTYTVEASSIRFSAEEMLRLLRQGAM